MVRQLLSLLLRLLMRGGCLRTSWLQDRQVMAIVGEVTHSTVFDRDVRYGGRG